jgi:hypothetical protein
MDVTQEEIILATAKVNFPAAWGITNYQSMETFNGIAYSGHVTLNASKIAFFVNKGDGGATMIQWNSGQPPEAWVQMAAPLRVLTSENQELLLECLLDRVVGVDK